MILYFFFFQAEDGIRDKLVTGVQTCALPILSQNPDQSRSHDRNRSRNLHASRARSRVEPAQARRDVLRRRSIQKARQSARLLATRRKVSRLPLMPRNLLQLRQRRQFTYAESFRLAT